MKTTWEPPREMPHAHLFVHALYVAHSNSNPVPPCSCVGEGALYPPIYLLQCSPSPSHQLPPCTPTPFNSLSPAVSIARSSDGWRGGTTPAACVLGVREDPRGGPTPGTYCQRYDTHLRVSTMCCTWYIRTHLAYVVGVVDPSCMLGDSEMFYRPMRD